RLECVQPTPLRRRESISRAGKLLPRTWPAMSQVPTKTSSSRSITNLSHEMGEVEVQSTEREGDRVCTLRSTAVCRPDHPHPRRKGASTSPARSAGEVIRYAAC